MLWRPGVCGLFMGPSFGLFRPILIVSWNFYELFELILYELFELFELSLQHITGVCGFFTGSLRPVGGGQILSTTHLFLWLLLLLFLHLLSLLLSLLLSSLLLLLFWEYLSDVVLNMWLCIELYYKKLINEPSKRVECIGLLDHHPPLIVLRGWSLTCDDLRSALANDKKRTSIRVVRAYPYWT